MNNRCQYQFELWEECNSHCKFCYLGSANNFTPDEIKIKNLETILQKISNLTLYKTINGLAYIGGEFFQGQLANNKVKKLFIELMQKSNWLLENKYIDELWISATLTIGDQKDLYNSLNQFTDLSKIWILTSYDTLGRFHSDKMKQLWLANLKNLRTFSSDLKINITSILTGDFISKYINNTLDIQQIAKIYNCSMFWKPPCSIDRQDDKHKTKLEVNKILPMFFPTRKLFLDFLYKYKITESSFLYDKLFNMKYRSDYLEKYTKGFNISHRIKDKAIEETNINCDVLKCGHSTQYQIYSDSDKCVICDKEYIKNII